MIEIAKRATACKGWRWMPGMLTLDDRRVVGVDGDVLVLHYADEHKCYQRWTEDAEPDLADPATLGCLLALVREAYDDSMIVPTTVYDTNERVYRWYTIGYGQGRLTSHGASLAHPTEAHAFVAALEAAP